MILSFLLTALTSGFLSFLFGDILYFFTIFISLIILNIQILSLFKGISPFSIISLNIIFFIITLALWLKKGKPVLKYRCNFKRVLNSLKLDKGLILLAAGVIFLITTGFILGAFLPVNEPDAVAYHTYRALVWAQKGFIHHFDTIDIRNLVMPINSELIYTWIFSLTKKDFGFGLLQLFSYFFGAAAFWVFFEKFKISYRKRLWAIFIYTSYAAVIAQISSTQTDLFTGTLLFYSILFFLDFIDKNDNYKGYFSSLSFALALGVKSTAFMAGLVLILLYLVYSIKRSSVKKFIKFAGFLIINFIIFSSYNYILNLIDFNNPLGSKMSIVKHGFYGGIKGFVANFITYNLQLFDFSGFMWGIYLSNFMAKVQSLLFNLFHIEQNTGTLQKLEGLNSSLLETNMGYGVVGILTFIPSILVSIFMFFKKRKSKKSFLYVLGIIFYLNLAVLSLAVGYMVYSIRFILTFYTISMPVLIFSYFKKNNIYKTFVIIFALFNLFLISTHLGLRPFNHILHSYRTESDYKTFMQNLRCLEYPYLKKNTNSCEIISDFLSYIEEYKSVGIFSGRDIMSQNTIFLSKEKHLKIDELLLARIDKYNITQYDYLLTPYPYQYFDVFNKEDEKIYLGGKMPANCRLIMGKSEEKQIIVSDNNKNKLKDISGGICTVPFDYLLNKGFSPIYQSETKWYKILNQEEVVSIYIIWKNNRKKY